MNLRPRRVSRTSTALQVLICAALFTFLIFASPAKARVTVRILLLHGVQSVQIKSSSPVRIYSLADERLVDVKTGGRAIHVIAQDNQVRLGKRTFHSFVTGGTRFRAQDVPIWVNRTPYRGAIDVVPSGGRLWIINSIRLEDYLRGVIGQEIPFNWPAAALRAQAVAARTFTLLIRKQAEQRANGNPLYHLTAGTDNQVYGGMRAEHPAIDAAISATHDLVLTTEGKIALTFFHAASGGHTEMAHAVWPSIRAPHLQGTPVPFERRDPSQFWTSRVGLHELRKKLFHAGHRVGKIISVNVSSRTPSGRAREIQIIHRNGRVRLRSSHLRKILGYTRVRSTLFTSVRKGNEVVFQGRGYGHGVGMSQQGARLMAEKGKGYTDILSFFYPGTTLQRVEQGTFSDEEILVSDGLDDLNLLLR